LLIPSHMEQTNKKIRIDNTPYTTPKVAIIAGSKSDQELSDKAAQTLKELDIAYEQQIISAHHDPDRIITYVRNSEARVYICIAGLSAPTLSWRPLTLTMLPLKLMATLRLSPRRVRGMASHTSDSTPLDPEVAYLTLATPTLLLSTRAGLSFPGAFSVGISPRFV